MSTFRFVKSFFYSALLALTLNSIIAAQCEGVYFDAVKPRLFPGVIQFSGTSDFNGDGKADLIGYDDYQIAPQFTEIKKIYILPQIGQGDFSSSLQEIPLPFELIARPIIVDFDTDGKNDFLVHLEPSTPVVLVYRNNGNGSFMPLSISPIVFRERILNVVDINNDGFADLLTVTDTGAFFQDQKYSYRLGNADGTFGNQVEIAPAYYWIAADFNNDGKIDFPIIVGSIDHKLRIYYNQGNGVFTPGNNPLDADGGIHAVRDFNNDGRIDFLLFGTISISILKNLGNDVFERTTYPLVPQSSSFPSVGSPNVADFNGDGFLDIIFYNNVQPFYSIFTNDGSGNFTRRDYNQRIFVGVPIGDIDGDNKTDFISVWGLSVNDSFYKYNGLFNETQLLVLKNVCDKKEETKLVDFDADRISDMTLWRPSDGRWRYISSRRNTSNSFFFGLNGDIPVPGDYDGDGFTDFAVYRPSDGTWYIRKSSDQAFLYIKFGLSSDKPVPSDYDGDGKTDIAVYRPSDGDWYVFNSSTQKISITHFGISEDQPLPEDYDADGKSDLAVFRPSTGVWYYLKSSDGNFTAIKWGIETDKPVPGDYDGDLKADIAVFRESEGNWYILRSYNLQYGVFRFGLPGDIPQPGDWNGNGTTDLAIYRPSTRTWWFSLWFTSGGSSRQSTFGSPDENPNSYILKFE